MDANIEQKLQAISKRLHETDDQHPELAPEFGVQQLTDAAVLLPLVYSEGEFRILFTERTQQVRTHKGQVSFPGGSYEPQDSDLRQTALRETWEETGIQAENVRILGSLSSHPTPSGFRVYPFVGFVSTYTPVLSADEVHTLFTAPVQHLLDPQNMEIKEYFSYGVNYLLPFFYWQEHIIWGATGIMLKDFLALTRDIWTS
mgnify:CR=1 FL=1